MFYVDFTLILNGTAWRRKAEENKVKDEGRRWCQNTVVSITTQANQATGTPDLHVSLAELARWSCRNTHCSSLQVRFLGSSRLSVKKERADTACWDGLQGHRRRTVPRTAVVGCSVTTAHLTLRDPMDYSPPGSSLCGISQARYWSGLPTFPSPGDPPDPRTQTQVSCLAGGFFTWGAKYYWTCT